MLAAVGLAAALIVGAAGDRALAQEAEPASPDAAKQLESLIATIEDEAKRAELLAQLKALLAAQQQTSEPEAADGGLLDRLSEHTKRVSADVAAAAGLVFEAPEVWPWIRNQARDPALRSQWIEVAWKLAAVLGAALLAEWLARLALRRPRRAVEGRETDTLLMRVPFLILRTVLDLLPLAAFIAAAYGVLPLTEPSTIARLVILALVNANVIARAVFAVARLVLTPAVPSLRVTPLRNETANYLFIWVRRLTNVSVYGFFALNAALLLGLPADAHRAILNFLGLIVAGMVVVFLVQNRRPFATWLKGRAPDRGGFVQGLRNRVADVWHVLAVAYTLAVFVVWALEIPGGFLYLARATVLTLVILGAAVLVGRVLHRALDRLFVIADEVKAVYPGLEARANRYLPALQTVLRGIILFVAIVAVLQAWGADAFGWLAGDIGRRLIGSAISILVIIVAALALWELVSSMIERYLARAEQDENSLERRTRLRTLLPLARKAIFVVLLVMVAMVILSELGINIAPLLAGAGVAGLAIGFGAQTLVKDIITGLFILVEDSIAVGDIVSAAGHTGVVEGLSIRTIRLRSYDGNVHTVPFSEVATIENFTKVYSNAVMDIGVAYREDVDQVMAVLKEIGAEMRADPDYGPSILEDLEIAGLDQFGDSAVVIRSRLKTAPAQQWGLRREFYRRVKARFDQDGIEIPFPHTTLYFGEDKEGRAPPAFVRIQEGDAASESDAKDRKSADAKPASKTEAMPLDTADKTAHLPGNED